MVFLPEVVGVKPGGASHHDDAAVAGELVESAERRGSAPEEQAAPVADPWEVLKAKLELNELVKQEMKSVIRAQHAKIEEYRKEVQALKRHMSLKDRASVQQEIKKDAERERRKAVSEESPSEVDSEAEHQSYSKVQLHLLEDMRREVAQSRTEQGELESQVRRLKNAVTDLRSRNLNLKRAARRYADMLSQLGAEPSALPSTVPTTPAILTRSPTACESALDESVVGASASEVAIETPRTSKTSLEGQGGSQDTASTTSRKGMPRKLPSSLQLSARSEPGCGGQLGGRRCALRATRDAMMLWHEENPRRLLHQLLYATSQIVDSPTAALFVADPWLRRSMEEREAEEGGCADGRQLLHTTFYLSGKVTVHGYRRDGLRAEAPRFPDLAALPIVGRGTVLALPLQAAPGRPILAALQATGAAAAPGAQEGSGEGGGSCNALALSDSQLAGVQLLCATAAGILDMRRQVECTKATHARTLGCFDLVMKLQSLVNVSELEQRAKFLMTSFFNVVTARITFYSPATRELLLTATTRASRRVDSDEAPKLAIGRRNITRISVQDGIVGRCVRKRQVFHLDPVMQSPFISEDADGVEIDGEKGQINMLAGPMIAELSEDHSRVVGVLQLIQKRQRREGDPLPLEQPLAAGSGDSKDKAARRPGSCDAFTQEDQNLFAELLRVLGMATYRTMQVQASVDMEEVPGQRAHPCIEKLLGVA